MKTLASSVLSNVSIPDTCTGCCRSSLVGLVMNMKLLSLEQTFLKPAKMVSGWASLEDKFGQGRVLGLQQQNLMFSTEE